MLDFADELEQQPGDWSTHANKGYVGKINRVEVSPSESWTAEYYIDQYLHSRGRPVTHWNRDVVTAALGKFNGQRPYTKRQLDEHLDGIWRLAAA